MKKIITLLIALGIYIRWVIHGYVSLMLGGRMFASALLYMLMHYVTLSRRSVVHKNSMIIWIIIVTISLIILWVTRNIRLGISVFLWHAALLSVTYSLEDTLTNRRTFSIKEFFQAGGMMFSMLFTLSFITGFIGRNQQFTLTCEQITSASMSVINFTERRFGIGNDEINDLKKDVVTDIVDSQVEMQAEALPESNRQWLGALLQTYKQQLIDETLANQKNVNQKVCQVFIDQIKELYEKPWFRVSVILLMFLVISPLLRITLFIISWVNMLLFFVLKKLGAYTIKKETVEVDTIV